MGLKDLATPSPFHIKPKAHAKKEETSEDELGRPKLLRGVVEDHPVLGQPRSLKRKAAHSQRQPSQSSQNKRTNTVGQLWGCGGEAILGEVVTSTLNARN